MILRLCRIVLFLTCVHLTPDNVYSQTSFKKLPDLGFGGSAVDISTDGRIVGSVVSNGTYGIKLEPAVWADFTSTPELLPTEGLGGFANAANASGLVVGAKFFTSGSGNSPVYWVNGVMKDLPTLGGGGAALDVNDSGLIVGYVRSGEGQLPALWQNDVLKVLPIPKLGTESSIIYATASGVNANGVIVGTIRVAFGSDSQSIKWVDTNLQTATSSTWLETRGIDIDDSGTVLVNGYLSLNGPRGIATYSASGEPYAFSSLDRFTDVWATGLSNNGTAIGYFFDFTTVPAGLQAGAWRNDRFFRLERPDGMRWAFPHGLNDAGTIVGSVSDGVSGISIPGYWLVDDNAAPETLTEIELTPAIGYPGQNVSVTAVITEDEIPVAGETITLEMGGSVIGAAVSNSQGLARLSFVIPAGAKAGDHSMSASIMNGAEDDASITVKSIPTRTALGDVTAQPGQAIRASGTLFNDLNRSPIRNQVVAMQIQGTSYTTKTDTKGNFSLQYRVPKNQKRGTSISMQASYSGNENHSKSSVIKSIRIR
jgi:hypothetical protein